jgi:hypothetical protein
LELTLLITRKVNMMEKAREWREEERKGEEREREQEKEEKRGKRCTPCSLVPHSPTMAP